MSVAAPVHILGVGAIGSLIAVHLREANLRPILLSRTPVDPAHPVSITLESDDGIELLQDFEEEAFQGDNLPISVLSVACKVQTTVALIGQLLPRLVVDSVIVFLQNGMGIAEAVEPLFHPQRRPKMVQTSVNHAVYLKSSRPNIHAVYASRGPLSYAIPPESPVSAYKPATNVLDALSTLQVLHLSWGDFKIAQIRKLALNAAASPTTALLQIPSYAMMNNDYIIGLQKAIVYETWAVLRAEIKDPAIQARIVMDDMLQILFDKIAILGEHVFSMAADVLTGRDTEIDYINGYIVRLGKKHGIPTPVNDTICALVKARVATNEVRLANPIVASKHGHIEGRRQ